MKRFTKHFIFLAVLGVLFITGCNVVAPPPPIVKDWTITITFNYDFTNFVPCSATVTKGCISGFTWGYVQGTNQVLLKTSLPIICTGVTQPETCTDVANSTLGIGPTVFYAQANGIDNNGLVVVSAQNNSPSQNVAIIAPTNTNATLK